MAFGKIELGRSRTLEDQLWLCVEWVSVIALRDYAISTSSAAFGLVFSTTIFVDQGGGAERSSIPDWRRGYWVVSCQVVRGLSNFGLQIPVPQLWMIGPIIVELDQVIQFLKELVQCFVFHMHPLIGHQLLQIWNEFCFRVSICSQYRNVTAGIAAKLGM